MRVHITAVFFVTMAMLVVQLNALKCHAGDSSVDCSSNVCKIKISGPDKAVQSSCGKKQEKGFKKSISAKNQDGRRSYAIECITDLCNTEQNIDLSEAAIVQEILDKAAKKLTKKSNDLKCYIGESKNGTVESIDNRQGQCSLSRTFVNGKMELGTPSCEVGNTEDQIYYLSYSEINSLNDTKVKLSGSCSTDNCNGNSSLLDTLFKEIMKEVTEKKGTATVKPLNASVGFNLFLIVSIILTIVFF